MRLSLVFKLNFKTLVRLFSAFIALNLLLMLLLFLAAIWKAESGAQDLVDKLQYSESVADVPAFTAPGYRITIPEDPARGFLLPSFVQDTLPVESLYARRSFAVPELHPGETFSRRIASVEYRVVLFIEERPYLIANNIGPELLAGLYILLTVAVFQFIILAGVLFKGGRSIRETLRPLSEMAEKARNLNEEVAGMGAVAEEKHIKNLAGAISDIDANRLDRRISVDSSQTELKDLAISINNMLNRISASYHSQIRFVSDASHELRTPISVIQGYVNLLDRWGKNDEKTMEEAIEAIKSESQGMKELVEKLLFLARGDNNTIQLHITKFDVCDLINEIIRETEMIDADHIIEKQLEGPVFINADQQLLKQAIRILVDNSIKFTPAGEKIVFKLFCDNGFVRVTVQDNGIGVSPEDLANIFNRFYRSDESRARKTGGSGLGLAIAQWIVERHGGHFEVLSRVDIGTRTTIVLPSEGRL